MGRKTVTPSVAPKSAKSKAKLPSRSQGRVLIETLEDRRVRLAAEKDAAERVARMDQIRRTNEERKKAASAVKMPVTLRSVYDTFVRRIKAVPLHVMRQEVPDPFTHRPNVLKIEAKFADLTMGQVLRAMEGLEVKKAVTKMEDMSYSHLGQWGHYGPIIKFRVSMYRYKDRSCLFIFTPDAPLPVEKKEKPKGGDDGKSVFDLAKTKTRK